MAKGINLCILAGNVCSEPELRTTQGGQNILSLRMATNDSYKDRDGAWKDTVEYHNVSVWGARGAALAKFVVKGMSVTVTGKLKTTSWEKDGVKRYKTEIVATEVVVAGRQQGDDQQGDSGGDQRSHGGGYAKGNSGGGQRQQSRPQQQPAQDAPADDFGGEGYGGDDGSDLPF